MQVAATTRKASVNTRKHFVGGRKVKDTRAESGHTKQLLARAGPRNASPPWDCPGITTAC
jgi:hypothetical protein